MTGPLATAFEAGGCLGGVTPTCPEKTKRNSLKFNDPNCLHKVKSLFKISGLFSQHLFFVTGSK